MNESLEKSLIANQNRSTPKSALSLSEVMTIVILFDQSGSKCAKIVIAKRIRGRIKTIFDATYLRGAYLEKCKGLMADWGWIL